MQYPFALRSLVKFWQYAAGLKTEERRGWKSLPVKRVESVADHSFAVALLGFLEGERRKYDTGKILKLALIHDLGEAITGDLTPQDKRILGAAKVEREREQAMRKVARTLPIESRRTFLDLWSDLRVLRTREARLVHQLDKVEMALQAKRYEKSVGRNRVIDFYRSAEEETTDLALKRVLTFIVKG